jgi:acyl carrier protein
VKNPQVPADLEAILLRWVRENNQADEPDKVSVDRHTRLMDAGILDSVGLLDLVAFAESKTGVTIELTTLNHDEFVAILSISGLCSILESRIGE